MKSFLKRYFKYLILLVFLIIAVIAIPSFTWIYRWGEKIENINLKDLEENPQNYLGERYAQFTIIKITLREDPYHRLVETYYLVYIKDSYGHEMPFVISENDYQKYKAYVGKMVTFKLNGVMGPEFVHPPNKLMTNILISKQTDPYAKEYCRIYITLQE